MKGEEKRGSLIWSIILMVEIHVVSLWMEYEMDVVVLLQNPLPLRICQKLLFDDFQVAFGKDLEIDFNN